MVAIAFFEAHDRRGQQTIKFGATFMFRHAVWVKRVGSVHDNPQGSGHVLRKQLCQARFYLQTGTPTLAKRG